MFRFLGLLSGELAKIQELKGKIRLSWGFWEKLWGRWGTPGGVFPCRWVRLRIQAHQDLRLWY